MDSKRKELLNHMIAIYIKDGEPIGSESLRGTIDMKISSSTIRNYFKVFVEEGILAQPHISSGRIPTNNTLKSYWRANIDILNVFEINNLEVLRHASEECKIFCNIKMFEANRLKEVINYQDKYMLVIFENSEAILPYSAHLYAFVNELVGNDIEEIKKLAKSVCANALYEKLDADSKVFNFYIKALAFVEYDDLYGEIIRGNLYYRLKNGCYFDLFGEGYIGILQDIKCGENYGKMFLAGELRRDYSAFYNAIAA